MGKTILTTTQSDFLQLASTKPEITNWFYLTGGTALAEFYLHHRFSEDLDFFTQNKIIHEPIDKLMKQIATKLHAKVTQEIQMGIYLYFLHFAKGGKVLKVDFAQRPFSELETGTTYHALKIASLWDITVDKLYTILHRTNARDFVDLYFAYQEVGCNQEQLIHGLAEKYELNIGEISIASRLLRIKDVEDYPKMIKPLDKSKMEDFYFDLAKEFEHKIFI